MIWTTLWSEKKITTLMVTHDMDYALEYGTRTILLDSGKIRMDLSGEERAAMTPGQLAEIFYSRTRRRGERKRTVEIESSKI